MEDLGPIQIDSSAARAIEDFVEDQLSASLAIEDSGIKGPDSLVLEIDHLNPDTLVAQLRFVLPYHCPNIIKIPASAI